MNDAEVLSEIKEIFLSGNFGSTEEVLFGLLIIVGALLLVIALIGLVFLILDVIGKWRMFKKAGESGWKALIPVYSTYIQCEIVGISPWWLLVIFICYLIASFFTPFKFICEIVVVYFSIIISLSTARSYGKTDGFGIGLFLLSPVFNMILGFDNSKYEGKKPVGDLLYTTITEQEKTKTEVKNTNASNKTKSTKKSPAKKTTTTKKVPAKKSTKTTTKKSQPKKKETTRKTKAAPKKATTRKKTTTTKKTTKK